MTNGDKYLKDGVDVEELNKEFVYFHKHSIFLIEDTFKRFFEQEVKPILSEDEKVILRNIREKKKYIKRFSEYDLAVYDEIAENGTTRSHDGGAYGLCAYSHLFQFIKPRRRI